jgi:protein-disulfide isomerase
MTKQFWAVLAVIALAFVGVIIFTGNKDSGSTASNTAPTNHVEGSTSTGVKLVEYGDYQCPACGQYYQAVKDTSEKYKDQIQFQFRNLPLTSLHPNAFAAARAAEAAGFQGKYFEMHDMLYENQSAWESSSNPLSIFSGYAKTLGLNEAQFKTDFASAKANNNIKADEAAFAKTKAEQATPTFFLNGKQLDSSQLVDANGQPSVDAFSKAIDAAIKAKQQ